MPDSIIERLRREFGKDKKREIKDAIRLKSNEVNIKDETVQFIGNLRKNGKIIVIIPYKNDLPTPNADLFRKFITKKQHLEDETDIKFSPFSADIDVNLSGRIDTFIVDVERIMPQESIDEAAKDFFSRTAIGYFSIVDDEGLTDKELALYIMFLKHVLEKRCSLKSVAMSANVPDKIELSAPHIVKVRKL